MLLATPVGLLWAVHIREAAAVQADRSGKVLIEKLRNTIKVGLGPCHQITVQAALVRYLEHEAAQSVSLICHAGV